MQSPQNPYNQPPLSNPSGGAPYGAPNMMGQNDSGTGAGAILPPQLQGLNWGAFLWTWIWSIANQSWIGLLCFVPCVGVIMQFVLLFKGNEYAWQNRRWESIEQFQEVQKKWAMWGVILLVASIALGFLAGVIGGIAASHAPTTTTRTTTTLPSSP